MSKESVALPSGHARLVEFLAKLLQLPALQEVRVSPAGISVTRGVEPVIPEGLHALLAGDAAGEPDLLFLMQRLDLQVLPAEKQRHQLETFVEAFAALGGRHPVLLASRTVDELAGYLGYEEGKILTTLFGVPVVAHSYVESGHFILFGSPTGHHFEIDTAVLLDTGALL